MLDFGQIFHWSLALIGLSVYVIVANLKSISYEIWPCTKENKIIKRVIIPMVATGLGVSIAWILDGQILPKEVHTHWLGIILFGGIGGFFSSQIYAACKPLRNTLVNKIKRSTGSVFPPPPSEGGK